MQGGKIVRGSNNFAGELITQTLCWICGILNPEYNALGGGDFRKECLAAIGEQLYSRLPKQMTTEIVYAEDLWNDYHCGMAFFTTEKIFDRVSL